MTPVPVILAGGIGERFWPLSRSSRPKQLLPITSDRSMLEETLRRMAPLCRKGVRPLIVTGMEMAPKIRAVVEYLEAGGRRAIVTDPLNIGRALRGNAGTLFLP